jgi:surface polysaccharide O-acyltransferase-like enzyme
MMQRKAFIDNLRWMTVMLLFPFHTFIIYNTFDDGNYIIGGGNVFLTNIIVSFWPWFMPLLFVLAGISSKYSLRNRKPIDYLKERFRKLFIPLLFGVLIIVPGMAYFADRFHNGYAGNYLQHYGIFFTKWTDLTGYDGGFSPGHLWFILYLFIISTIALPIIIFYNRAGKKINLEKINIIALLLFFIFPLAGQLVLDINGKSLGEYFAYYMIGYFILSDDIVIKKCEKCYLSLSAVAFAGMIIILVLFNSKIAVNDVLYETVEKFYAFSSILALLGIGKKHFNVSTKVTGYLSESSFFVYVFHLFWITAVAYVIFKFTRETAIQVFVILLFSIILTFASYKLLRRFAFMRAIFCLNN